MSAFASVEDVALVLVRSKAPVLGDFASGTPWLMELDCIGVVGPTAAISETLSSLGVPAWSLSIESAHVEDIDSSLRRCLHLVSRLGRYQLNLLPSKT